MGDGAGTSGQSNIAAMLLEAAQSVLHSSVPEGFEWVQEYGMYYSYSTRYFYDMNTGLFYHPDTQIYYYFDETTGSYCVYANMQKKKWTRSRNQKRALSLLGENEIQKYGQDEVDICEKLFTIVDKVVDAEWEKKVERKYGRKHHRERERDREERHRRRDKRDSHKHKKEHDRDDVKRKNKAKRAYIHGEEIFVSSEEDESTRPRKRHARDETSVSSSEENHSSGLEENGDDERIRMMQDEGYTEAPLLRIIDQLGQLHIVTSIEGAFIGSHPQASLRSESLAEEHVEIYYDFGENGRSPGFRMRMLTSDSSTSLDGQPLAENDEISVEHGSWFTAGDMILIIHVHYGYNLCPKCDPGQMKPLETNAEKIGKQTSNGYRLRGDAARKRALNAMKRQYGIAEYEPSETRHVDRAAVRRQEVGSEYPINRTVLMRQRANDPNNIYSGCAAKPVPGATVVKPKTVDTPIEAENKGFKLLKAMGWKEGKGLGKEEGGRAEPVAVTQKSDRAGLGTQNSERPKSHKQMMVDVMRKRFNEIAEREK